MWHSLKMQLSSSFGSVYEGLLLSAAKYDHFNLQTEPSVRHFWDASPDLLGAGNTSNSRYLSDFEEISLLGMVDYPGSLYSKFILSCL